MSTKTHVLEIHEVAPWWMLFRSCVDCGLRTGCWCEGCYGAHRFPEEEWAPKQHTPLCNLCDNKFGCCHYCRGQRWATPPPHGPMTPIMSPADTCQGEGRSASSVGQPQGMHGSGCLPAGDASHADAPLVAPKERQKNVILPGVRQYPRATKDTCFGSWYDGFLRSYIHQVEVEDVIVPWTLTVRTKH